MEGVAHPSFAAQLGWLMRRHLRKSIVDLTEMSCSFILSATLAWISCSAMRGEIQFWIDAGDLAARRFDRVWANTQGG